MTQANTTEHTTPAPGDDLISADFMRQIDQLDVLSRKVLSGKLRGERRSKKRGQSVEFADHRNYVPGDDLRFIDWNLYARLDRLFLKLFTEEQDLSLSILLDVSTSMGFGNPNKLLYAKRLAAGLGYIGLAHYNRVHFYTFTDTLVDQLTNFRGRGRGLIPRVLQFLQQQQPHGAGDLARVFRQFARMRPHTGIVVLIGDLLDKGDFIDQLGYLASQRNDVYLLQLLAPQEIDPSLAQITGDLKLQDAEDLDFVDISATPALIKQYQANLQNYCQHLHQACLKRGITHMVNTTTTPFDTLILQHLREQGLLG